MTDPAPSPLAAKALQRLQKLAEGNGLAPDAIHLYGAEEKEYAFEGVMTLLPLFETQNARMTGGPRGRDRRIMGSVAEMKNEVSRLKEAFESKASWITEAMTQLKEQPAGGWGLDDVKIALPSQSVVLAASEVCPSCSGNKMLSCTQCNANGSIICPHCGGNRQEICHICMGSGNNPSQPDQPCINCQGMRYTRCRYCNGSGQLTCPTCHGRRGTPCSTCGATGGFTEEVEITCGARTQFKIMADGLPSGLRRGLDRLGMARLAEGHADIETLPAVVEEEDTSPQPIVAGATEPKKEKAPKPEVHYMATMPYADLRMGFAGKKVIVNVFGKKQVLLGVPPFLDTALEPAREYLLKATRGESNLDAALQARVMKDALKLQLAGQGKVNALRRIYPQGLSPKVAGEILGNMRLALNRMTLRSRTLVAVICAVIGYCVFAGVYLTPLRNNLTAEMNGHAAMGFDLAVLIGTLVACWFALSAAIRFVLQKHFPDYTIPITQKTGKTGLTMLAALVVAFVLVVMFAPLQPEWVQTFYISKK